MGMLNTCASFQGLPLKMAWTIGRLRLKTCKIRNFHSNDLVRVHVMPSFLLDSAECWTNSLEAGRIFDVLRGKLYLH